MAEELIINHLFAQTAQRFPQKVCLQIERNGAGERYTYAQVEELARKVAAYLINVGIGKSDFVLLVLENSPEWAIFYLGIIYSGACVVPIDPQLTKNEIENITADCNPKAVFTSQSILKEKDITSLRFKFKEIVLVDYSAVLGGDITDFESIKKYDIPKEICFPQLSPDDNASLIYTSGTTGVPKGVLLSHRNFCSNVKSFDKLKFCTEDDNFLSILPLFHSYAFMALLLVPLLTGATISYCLSFKSEDVAHVIKKDGVTIVPAVPQFFSLLRNKIFSIYDESPAIVKPFILFFTKYKVRKVFGRRLRLFVSGGARLGPNIAKDISKLGIKVLEGYGLTETSPVVSLNPSEKIKFGSVGKPIPDVEVKINNPDKSGIGEILIKGHNVMKGYFKRPDLTKEVIKDGWFYSCDLGYLDEEGYLFITGRLKEVIVLSSGKNVYPEELEAIYGSSPYIKELCILSRDEERALHAVIVPEFSYLHQMNVVNIQDIIRWEIENISKRLPSYNHIMGFTIVKESLPRTRLGKIKRFELQEIYGKVKEERRETKEKRYLEDDLSLIELDASKKVLNFLEKKLKKDIALDDNLEIDLGIDSLGRVELVDGLERFIDIKIPNSLIAKVFTVRELLSEINTIKSKGTVEKLEEKIFDWKELLNELPPAGVLEKIRLKPSIFDKIFMLICPKFFFFLFRVFWRLEVEGTESLPKKGPYILCSNHASYLDGFIVGTSLPYRIELNTFFLGYAGYFEHPLAAWGIRLGRLVPLDPATHLVETMQASSFILRNGKIMCMFPEGRRSRDENVQDFKKGVGIIAKELGVPLVPVYIKGSHFAWPRTERFPRLYPLKIIYGRPLSADELLKKSKEKDLDEYERIVRALREKVIKLGAG